MKIENSVKQQELSHQLFKSVFSNIVLFKLIYSYVKLYEKNKCVVFNSLKELQDYRDREYIYKIVYTGSKMLNLGDLPTSGGLREIEFYSRELSSIKGCFIPYGVEKILYSPNNTRKTAPLSTLPSTVNTIKNVVLNYRISININIIPPNITSIEFRKCPNISGIDEGNGFIKIPDTVKKLKFSEYDHWDNEGIQLSRCDFSDSLISLSILDFREMKFIAKGVLPNSIRNLKISYNNTDNFGYRHNDNGYFNFMPPNVEKLFILCNRGTISPPSNLLKCSSIKKLTISFYKDTGISPYSLPSSITDLTLYHHYSTDEIVRLGTIPDSVTNLNLKFNSPSFDIISNDAIPNSVTKLEISAIIKQFPSSLTSLKVHNIFSLAEFYKMIPKLPKSLTLISLPETFKKFSPSKLFNSITKIKFH